MQPKLDWNFQRSFQGAKSTTVILGAHNITNEYEPGQIRIRLSPFWVLSHHLFWLNTFRNDIALIKLPEPVEMNEFIQTVGLPIHKSSDLYGDLYVGSEVNLFEIIFFKVF